MWGNLVLQHFVHRAFFSTLSDCPVNAIVSVFCRFTTSVMPPIVRVLNYTTVSHTNIGTWQSLYTTSKWKLFSCNTFKPDQLSHGKYLLSDTITCFTEHESPVRANFQLEVRFHLWSQFQASASLQAFLPRIRKSIYKKYRTDQCLNTKGNNSRIRHIRCPITGVEGKH